MDFPTRVFLNPSTVPEGDIPVPVSFEHPLTGHGFSNPCLSLNPTDWKVRSPVWILQLVGLPLPHSHQSRFNCERSASQGPTPSSRHKDTDPASRSAKRTRRILSVSDYRGDVSFDSKCLIRNSFASRSHVLCSERVGMLAHLQRALRDCASRLHWRSE